MDKRNTENKLVLTFLTISLLMAGSLMAQPEQNENRGPKLPDSAEITKMMDELAENLSLTEDQKSKISELHFAHFSEAKVMREKRQGDRENNREAMENLRKGFDEQVGAVLTDDQKKDYKKYMKKRGPKYGMRGKHGKGRGEDSGEGRGKGRKKHRKNRKDFDND